MKPQFADVELIVFDLDGTLVDTREDLAAAVNHALRKFGRPPMDVDTVTACVGDGVTKLLQRVLQDSDEEKLKKGRQWFSEYYLDHLTDRTRPYPGVEQMLSSLGRIKKAVLTNKSQEFTLPLLEKLGLAHHFVRVVGGNAGFPAKPEAQGLAAILSDCEVTPAQTLMVGDSPNDILVARAAGTRVCAVAYGYRSVEELRQHSPDAVIERPEQLLELLPQIQS